MITITLPNPPSVGHRFTISRKTGQMILTSRARKWKQDTALVVRSQYRGPVLDGRCAVVLTLHPRMNKDGSANARLRDLDNIGKVALDALSGIVYADDSQIDVLTIQRGDAVKDGGVTAKVEVIA